MITAADARRASLTDPDYIILTTILDTIKKQTKGKRSVVVPPFNSDLVWDVLTDLGFKTSPAEKQNVNIMW